MFLKFYVHNTTFDPVSIYTIYILFSLLCSFILKDYLFDFLLNQLKAVLIEKSFL